MLNRSTYNDVEVVGDSVVKNITLRLIPLLLICYIFAHLDRVNIGFAKQTMSLDLGFTDTVYGVGAGLFFISYMLFGVPANYILDRLGARRWLAIMMILWGIISTSMMFVTGIKGFYTLRFLLGMAEAGFFPGILIYINRWFPARKRGQITALFTIAVPLASVLGAPLSGWIIETFHASSGLHGWQWMFLMEGIPIVFLGLVVLFYLPEHFRNVSWLTDREKTLLAQEISEREESKEITSFIDFFKNIKLLQLFAIYFCVMLGINAINFWMPTLIHSTGIVSDKTVGMLTAIPWALSALFMVFLGWSADKHNERRWHLIIPLLMVAFGFTGAGLFPSSALIVMLMLSIATMGAATGLPMFWQLPPAFMSDKAAIGGIALISSLGNLAGFIAPALIGWIKDLTNSPSIGLYILSVIIIAGAVLILAIPARSLKH